AGAEPGAKGSAHRDREPPELPANPPAWVPGATPQRCPPVWEFLTTTLILHNVVRQPPCRVRGNGGLQPSARPNKWLPQGRQGFSEPVCEGPGAGDVEGNLPHWLEIYPSRRRSDRGRRFGPDGASGSRFIGVQYVVCPTVLSEARARH